MSFRLQMGAARESCFSAEAQLARMNLARLNLEHDDSATDQAGAQRSQSPMEAEVRAVIRFIRFPLCLGVYRHTGPQYGHHVARSKRAIRVDLVILPVRQSLFERPQPTRRKESNGTDVSSLRG